MRTIPSNTEGSGSVLRQVGWACGNTAWYWIGFPIPNSNPSKHMIFRTSNANSDSRTAISTSKRSVRGFQGRRHTYHWWILKDQAMVAVETTTRVSPTRAAVDCLLGCGGGNLLASVMVEDSGGGSESLSY